jgi:hypothetical protein
MLLLLLVIKQSVGVPHGYSEYVYEFNFPMTVVSKFLDHAVLAH